jgi:predicted dehydrogenase
MDSSTTDQGADRREFLKAVGGAAAFTTALFTGRVEGANDRIAIGFIGMGAMGTGNLGYAMKQPEVQAVAVCDVYQPHLDRAMETAKKAGHDPKAVKDFRQILADKAVDAVCIATPDHWHAYMEVEACKAGKDVFVEKPACVYVEEGLKMVQAARKYNRVVQAGTMQRSGHYFQKAVAIVKSGALGDITFCRTFQAGLAKQEGWGNPPDEPAPEGLDWDMWLGPAPKRPFNVNRWGIPLRDIPKRFSTFRYFWDYAGGAMTDWGVHLLDPLQSAFDEAMPRAITAQGDRFYVKDNTETPDTMLATFHYPGFIACYESRTCNPFQLYNQGYGTAFHGTKGTMMVNRSGCWVIPNKGSDLETVEEKSKELSRMNEPHWANFIACIKTRQKPTSDIETCVRSTITCLLANLAMRYEMRLGWDEKNMTVVQPQARPYLKLKYRAPWKLAV